MASTKVITAKYIDYIAEEVIGKFGGSYQTVETLGKTWRQRMDYYPIIEDFIMLKTKVFLRVQDVRDTGNFNMMYKVCYNIADYLSKYLVKKSENLTRVDVTKALLNELFFNSSFFVPKFKKAYKRPIDTTNERYVAANPGVVAMYNALKSNGR